jgi:hypothetical protein
MHVPHRQSALFIINTILLLRKSILVVALSANGSLSIHSHPGKYNLSKGLKGLSSEISAAKSDINQ